MTKLNSKVALVTGASKGIGASIAELFAAEGATVVVNYARGRKEAERVVETIIAAGGRASVIQADISKPDQASRLIETTLELYGRLDVLVNNAGVYTFAPLEEITEADFRHIYDINVFGLLMVTQAASKVMLEGGSIINISSDTTTSLTANSALYSGSKAAVDAITQVISKEMRERNIRVNAINPGLVDTEGTRAAAFVEQNRDDEAISEMSMLRLGVPKDIALIALFLASNDARWMTGETLLAAGGWPQMWV